MASQSKQQKLKLQDRLKYLQGMKKNLDGASNQIVQTVLKGKQTSLQCQIQKGDMQVNQQNPEIKSSVSLTNSKSSVSKQKQKRPFYMSSNPQIIRQNYERYQALKQEYSHEKTSEVVKQVEQKIKGWMKKQKSASNKRFKFIEKLKQEQQRLQTQQKQTTKKSLQTKKQEYKRQILQKIQKRSNQKRQIQQDMHKQSISKRILKEKKVPLFKEKQIEYEQKQKQQEFLYKYALKQKRDFFMAFNSDARKQHEKKYMQEVKERNQKRGDNPNQTSISLTRSEFITAKSDKLQIQHQEQMKRIRIKEYVQRLKSMSPDQTTLDRIKRVKEEIISREKILQEKKRNSSRLNLKLKTQSTKNLFKKENQAERKQLGDNYLKQKKTYNKVRTQSQQVVIQNVEQYNITFNAKNECQKVSNLIRPQDLLSQYHPVEQGKVQKNESQNSLKKQKNSHKRSYKKLQTRKQRTLTLPSIQKRPEYKNYLSQLKLKAVRPLTQMQMVKKNLKQPALMLRQFNRRSIELQKQMIAKIKQYKRGRVQEKYQKNLAKQIQIDDLYHQNLEMKLACLELS